MVLCDLCTIRLDKIVAAYWELLIKFVFHLCERNGLPRLFEWFLCRRSKVSQVWLTVIYIHYISFTWSNWNLVDYASSEHGLSTAFRFYKYVCSIVFASQIYIEMHSFSAIAYVWFSICYCRIYAYQKSDAKCVTTAVTQSLWHWHSKQWQ